MCLRETHKETEFTRADEYFSPALMLVRRKMDGIRDSLVASSVWRPQFKKQLECYPELNIVDLEFALPTCDACQLGGRMSTRLGRLSGHPYDRETFEVTFFLLSFWMHRTHRICEVSIRIRQRVRLSRR